MNWNLVGNIYGRSSMKIAQLVPPQAILVSGWLISNKAAPLKPSNQMNRNLVGSTYGRPVLYKVSSKPNERWSTQAQPRGVTIHFFYKRYLSRYLICFTIRFIGNCNYSLKSMLVDMGAAMFFFIWGRLRTSGNYKYLIN